MKRIVWMALAAIVPLILMADTMTHSKPEPTLKSKYVLTDLWKKYAELAKQDLPKQEAAALAEIRDEAMRQKLPLDFWEAAKLYYESVTSRNWKVRSEEQAALQKYVKEYDDPLVTYLWMVEVANFSSSARWSHVQKNATRLQGHRPELYVGLTHFMGGVLEPFIRTDYEYTLWHLANTVTYDYTLRGPIYKALEENLGDSYPGRAFYDYYILQNQSSDYRKAPMQVVAKKYEGTAAALFPRADLLSIEKRELDIRDASTEDYKALYKRCKAFVSDAQKFKGDEAQIAKAPFSTYSLMEELTSTSIRPTVEGNEILVVFRNLEKADVTLSTAGVKHPKTVERWKKVKNPVNSFYVKDTARIALPALPDGDYQILATSGDNDARTGYSQHRLSLSIRLEEAGPCAYVADYKSGKPLEKATLVLWNGSERVSTATVDLDGYTLLPAKFRKKMQSKDIFWTLSAETGTGTNYRNSESLGLPYYYGDDSRWSGNDGVYCNLYKDQGAYNPGDTFRYKVVLYKGNLIDAAAVLPNRPVKVELRDPEGKKAGEQELTTNEFGSASGSFQLPTDRRNGRYQVVVRAENRYLLFERVIVDEFVLPTFSLSFDQNDKLYAPGDTVAMSGTIKSFSGHALTGTDLEVKVESYGKVYLEETIQPGKDGRFSFSFKTGSSGRYYASVRAVDPTGETQEFQNSVYISDNIHVSMTVDNKVDGTFVTMEEKYQGRRSRYSVPPSRYGYSRFIVTEPQTLVTIKVTNNEGEQIPVPVKWELFPEGEETAVASGTAASGETVSIDFKAIPSGLYILKANAQERKATDKTSLLLFVLKQEEKVLDAPIRRVFLPGETNISEGGTIHFRMGSADGAEWAIVTLFGKDRKVLETRKVVLSGEKGAPDSLVDLDFEYKDSYPDAVRLHVFYFKHGEAIQYEWQYRRIRTRLVLPLTVSRFQDKLFPDTEYSFSLKTAPGAEALVAVWDKSLDAIATNDWHVVTLREFSLPYVCINNTCGRVTGKDPYGLDIEEDDAIVEYEAASSVNDIRAKGAILEEPMMMSRAGAAMDEASAEEEVPDVKVRSKFETALTFQPHLRSDAAGNLDFSFRTSDKLSTYYVGVYAHDANMRNAYVCQEVVVSVPVKVSVTEPRFLYRGDQYQLAASLSSLSEKAEKGSLYLSLYNGEDYKGVEPISVQKVDLTVPAGGVVNHRFDVKVPEGVETLGMKLVFASQDFSDGVFVPVPVLPNSQVLTEAHSAVYRPSQMSYDDLVARLRKEFVNTDGAKADLSEITVLDMVRDAIPGKVEPAGKDVLSVSEAWYMRLMASRLEGGQPLDGSEEQLLQKVMECQCGDGGFAWFQGMKSSPVITAVLLERFAKLSARGFQMPSMKSAVQFLDSRHFSMEEPVWCGALSDEQYMYIRSLYPDVPFEVKPTAKDEKKRMETFKKDAKDYLVPSKADGRGLKGQILNKSRRLATLRNLSATDEGVKLAAAWGVTFAAKAKLDASLSADLQSLLEYAVEHRDGGWYYPNAVMPWRGLMESEAYAHSLICDLFASMRKTDGAKKDQVAEAEKIADGIRLWLMLQKETQHWDTEPAFTDAITSIMDGSEDVLGTRVVILKSTFEIPFTKVKAAGNGFKISRRFVREVTVNGNTREEEIKSGTVLHVGDRIRAEYRIWNGENRSFVKVDAFREASLQPVQQLSGHLGWGFIPYISYGRGFSFGPQGYRNVKADRTEYFFDAFPEEYTTLTEDFFVQQAGVFTAPVLTVESLYAPHYRANSASKGTLKVEPVK